MSTQTQVILGNEEDMLYFPYNSELNEFGERDRLYDAQDWRDNFALFISDGVFPNPSNQLRVDAMGTMVLTLRAGNGWIDGGSYVQRRDFEFAVGPAHLTLPRRDTVILRHDIIARHTVPIYIEGTPSINPQVPPLTRTDDVYELRLCEITVGANAQSLTQSSILDTRPNNDVCGFVTGLVHSVDTTDLFEQYYVFLQEQIALWELRKQEQMQQWADWTADRDRWTEEQRLYFVQLGEQITNLIKSLETQSFNLINNNFEDWSVMRGCNRVTTFLADGSIVESITVVAIDFLLATRTTTFNSDDSITEEIIFNNWERVEGSITTLSTAFTVSRTTFFEADGSIREEVR